MVNKEEATDCFESDLEDLLVINFEMVKKVLEHVKNRAYKMGEEIKIPLYDKLMMVQSIMKEMSDDIMYRLVIHSLIDFLDIVEEGINNDIGYIWKILREKSNYSVTDLTAALLLTEVEDISELKNLLPKVNFDDVKGIAENLIQYRAGTLEFKKRLEERSSVSFDSYFQ